MTSFQGGTYTEQERRARQALGRLAAEQGKLAWLTDERIANPAAGHSRRLWSSTIASSGLRWKPSRPSRGVADHSGG